MRCSAPTLTTLFPLQAALGYEITQSLFVGKATLLVEGPSDLLYLKWFSRRLREAGRTYLDDRWVIAPCGGVDKVGAFMTLFGANALHVAVFMDFAEGQKGKLRSLRESSLLRTGHVLTADAYSGGQPDADIEDMVGRSNYAEIVNAAYALKGEHKLRRKAPLETSGRVVKDVEAAFRKFGPEIPEFDHLTPAVYLLEHGHEISLPDMDVTLSRFERLFEDLNHLLGIP